MASALSAATGRSYEALTLPPAHLSYAKDRQSLEALLDGTPWTCDLKGYTCKKAERRQDDEDDDSNLPRDCRTFPADKPLASPDGRWEAVVRNYNVAIRPKTSTRRRPRTASAPTAPRATTTAPTSPGRPIRSIAAYRVRPGYRREVHYVESSPGRSAAAEDTRRVATRSRATSLDVEQPVLFDVDAKQTIDDRQRAVPERLRDAARWCGARTAAPSPSSTTSAATRSTASSRSTPRPARARAVDLGGAEDVLLLPPGERHAHGLGQALSLRRRRRQGDHLDVGARRLEPPLSVRRRDRRGEEPDHEGRLGRARRRARSTRRSGRSGSAPAA